MLRIFYIVLVLITTEISLDTEVWFLFRLSDNRLPFLLTFISVFTCVVSCEVRNPSLWFLLSTASAAARSARPRCRRSLDGDVE